MKKNLKMLIDSVENEIELIYDSILNNPSTHEVQRQLVRYSELNNFLTIYKSLYGIEDEEEFKKVLDNYIDQSIDNLNKELEKYIEKEEYEKCSEIKSEIELINQLKL